MNIIIGISWPFANGEPHIGHAASSLPGDIIASLRPNFCISCKSKWQIIVP